MRTQWSFKPEHCACINSAIRSYTFRAEARTFAVLGQNVTLNMLGSTSVDDRYELQSGHSFLVFRPSHNVFCAVMTPSS